MDFQFPFLVLLAKKVKKPLVVFDLETTGLLSSAEIGVTELACLKIHPSGAIERFQSLVNPECALPEEVAALTGITEDMVMDKLAFPVVWAQAHDFFQDALAFGFNSNNFDVKVLETQWQRYGMDVAPLQFYDVRVWHQIIQHGSQKGTLLDVARQCGAPMPDELHRAAADVEVTAHVMNTFLQEEGLKPLRDKRIKFSPSTPPIFPPQATASDTQNATDIFSWVESEMGVNGYAPLSVWAGKLNLPSKHLEELLETAIDTRTVNPHLFAHKPTQHWLKQNDRLLTAIASAYPSEHEVGKLHYPFQRLNVTMLQEKASHLIFDFVQLRIAMIDLGQPYVTRRGFLESSVRDQNAIDQKPASSLHFGGATSPESSPSPPATSPKKSRPSFC